MLISEDILICNIENLFGGNFLARNSEGVKYFDVMISLMNPPASKFWPGI